MADKNKDKEKGNGGGPPTVKLRIQTPRGEWNMTNPSDAAKRPVYPISTKIEQVIADTRAVFGFVEDDNQYKMFHGTDPLEPQRPLASYHFVDGTLLILSVQGGNAYQHVEPAVSLEAIKSELMEAAAYAASIGVELDHKDLTPENLVFKMRFFNRTGESFFARFDCTEFPLLPPFIEFTDESGGSVGQKNMYPSCFHASPCVCMRYSRKAYQEHGGPHGEWRMIDWHLATSGGGPIGTLGMIISDLHAKILECPGRMQ